MACAPRAPRAPHAPGEARGGMLPRRAFPRSGRHFSGGALPRRAHRMRRRAAEGSPPRPFPAFLGEVAASRAAQSALRRIRPPPGIVGRAGTAGGSSLAGLSVFWGIVRRGGLIGVVRRAGAFFIFMRPRRGSRVRAECPPGGLPPAGLSVFGGLSLPENLREAFLLDRSCARHAQEDLRGPPCGHSNVNVV